MSLQQKNYDVVMLTTVHRATDCRIFHREAKTLARAGLSVCVIGQHPKSECIDGVSISALPEGGSRAQRLLLDARTLKRALEISGKLYIFHDPELFGVALLLRALGKKVVFDCHEIVPLQILQKYWIPKPLRLLLSPMATAWLWLTSRMLSGIIAVNEVVAGLCPNRRTIVIRNTPDQTSLEVSSQGEPVHLRRNIVIYAGLISRIRGISELVDSFRELQGLAELWLVGEFDTEDFQRQIVESMPANVEWLGWKASPELFKLYQQAKIGVHIPYPTKNHRRTMPTKMFQYLGSGLPMIASNFPEWTEVLEGCGIQVDPRDVGQIRDAIRSLLESDSTVASMSAVGRERVAKYFDWEQDGETLVNFCSSLIGLKRLARGLNIQKSSTTQLFGEEFGPEMASTSAPIRQVAPLAQAPESRD